MSNDLLDPEHILSILSQFEQEHPEHHGAVETTPVRGDLVKEGLHAIGVPLNVADGIVTGDEGVDDDARGHRHQRGDGIERGDTAFDEAGTTPTGAGHGGCDRVSRGHERNQQDQRAE